MHESGLIETLVERVTSLARENGARRVVAIEVSVGALAAVGADHLREHFRLAVAGTLADGAELRVRTRDYPTYDLPASDDPTAAALVLENVELER